MYGALIRTGSHGCVSEGNKLVVIWSKDLPCLLSRLLKINDHKAAHEEGGVGLFGVVKRGVMINFVRSILLVSH